MQDLQSHVILCTVFYQHISENNNNMGACTFSDIDLHVKMNILDAMYCYIFVILKSQK